MNLYTTSDLHGDNQNEIIKYTKLTNAFEKIFNDELEKNYTECDIKISVVLRFFSKKSTIKTFRRFNKNENTLLLDYVFHCEEYSDLYFVEATYKLSHEIFNYIEQSIIKYKFEKLNIEKFLDDLRKSMKINGWLADEIDYSLLEDGEF